MGTRWRGLLAPLGTPTGDGRRILASGVTHRELPLPLKWQRTDEGGHDSSVVVGMTDTLTVSDTEVWGEGELFDDVDPAEMPRLHEDVSEAKHLLGKGVVGPSVDPGAAAAVLVEAGSDEPLTDERLEELLEAAWEAGEDPDLELLFTEYEIAAATLVTVPAFAQCRPFELTETEPAAEAALTAAVRSTGWDDLPLADREQAWDGAAAAARVAEVCGLDGDDPDWDCYAAAFLHRDDDADPQTRGAYGFGIADIIDGTPRIVPRAVYAVAGVLQGARGGSNLSDAEQDRMRQVVDGLYERMRQEWDDESVTPPWAGDGAASAAVRAALTAAAPTYDPAWFGDPALPAVTPLTLQDVGDGVTRVFGHIATHDTCHVGMRDVCTTAPVSNRDYIDFHRYTATASGVPLPVPAGRITTGHGQYADACSCCPRNDDHACTRLSMGAAVAHHDRLRPVAYGCVGEDTANNAIWFAGVLAPEADERDRAVLARRQVSGDWRDIGGNLELVEVLALSRERPGFPLPRTAVAAGRQYALTAAGTVRPTPAPDPAPPGAYAAAAGEHISEQMRVAASYLREQLEPVAAAFAAAAAQLSAGRPAPGPPDPVAVAAGLAAEIEAAVATERALEARALADEVMEVSSGV